MLTISLKTFCYLNAIPIAQQCIAQQWYPSTNAMLCPSHGSVCILNHSNKINQKMVDVIIKYVEKNEWKVTKGNIVESTKNLELKDDLFSI